IVTPLGIVVIDAQQHEGLARRFRAALEREIGKPLRSLINTHYHGDHIDGNPVFADAVPILAHERTLQKLEALLGPRQADGWVLTDAAIKCAMFYGENIHDLVPDGDPAWEFFLRRFGQPEYATLTIKPPTETFADRFAFPLPDDTVRLDYRGPAHCDGDIVVHLERRKVAFLGDLYFQGRVPWIGDCDLDGWIATLDQILKLDLEIVVPGHGVP